jgi:hypothetical protein
MAQPKNNQNERAPKLKSEKILADKKRDLNTDIQAKPNVKITLLSDVIPSIKMMGLRKY